MPKKKKRQKSRGVSVPKATLAKPVAALRLRGAGPRENGRAWVGTETFYATGLPPGTIAFLTVGTQPPLGDDFGKEVSNFSPAPLSVDDFTANPPQSLYAAWGVDPPALDAEWEGDCAVGCELWPNAGLRKGEVQLSSDLRTQLGEPEVGCALYLHTFDEEPSRCRELHLLFVKCISDDEDKREWLEEKLAEGGVSHLEILKVLARQQLHGRVLFRWNLVSVQLLGCQLLLRVQELHSSDGLLQHGRFDGDCSRLELLFGRDLNPDRLFLDHVERIAGDSVEGSRREAAVHGALTAARTGLAALEGLARDDVVLPPDLEQALQSTVILPLTRPCVFTAMGLPPPRGIILHGPPGSGKTLIAGWAAKLAKAHFFVINGPSLVSEFYGGSEAGLDAVFRSAQEMSPSVVFMDEADAVLPSRESNHRGVGEADAASGRRVSALLSAFDCLDGSPVVVLAATNRIEAIDEALRRPGRFDREIEMTAPTPQFRQNLFHHHLRTVSHSLAPGDIQNLAEACHGFLPADVTALCREASLCALRRWVMSRDDLRVGKSDFEKAKALVGPSGLRELQVEVPRVRWEDIGGLEDVKQQLRESVEWPLRHAASLAKMGTSPPKGILLFGPPGCSKTLLAKAVATETGMNFLCVHGAEMMSAFVGESEKAVARLFKRARQVAPCILFMDEVDGLMIHRDESGDDGTLQGHRILVQLLSEMDGIRDRGNVTVIGATNKPQLIDPAMLRPGRFDRLILVPPPDLAARSAIFGVCTKRMQVDEGVDVDVLAEQTGGYSGADIASVCREAGVQALQEDLAATRIRMEHFRTALEKSTPSLGREATEEMEIYESFHRGCQHRMK